MSGGAGRRRRVLFIAEAATLAHVARPLALASSLDPARYEVIFASEPRFGLPPAGIGFEHRPIRSIPVARVMAALAKGSPLFDATTLDAYVDADLDLIGSTRPDAVVGDCRLSLSASARLAGVPYLALTNAYWSPHRAGPLPMPDLPMARWLGVGLSGWIFDRAIPRAMGVHARPLDRVRVRRGLGPLGPDFRRAYTDADRVLFADIPELSPTEGSPPHHAYIGPVAWSPPVGLPGWWGDLPDDRPVIYATPGSSGSIGLLAATLRAAEGMPVAVVAATAGRALGGPVPANARVADYLPGSVAARRSSLVISNGGSPTGYQALAAGVPVLGLAGNMDQHLAMEGVVARGAGHLIRFDQARPRAIRARIEAILSDPSHRSAAGEIAAILARWDAPARFAAALGEVIGPGRG